MTIEIYLNGHVVQRSRNLRGLISRAYKIGVTKAAVFREHVGASYYVEYADGSILRGNFCDFTVCRDFFRARWQKWGLYAEVRDSDDMWHFI